MGLKVIRRVRFIELALNTSWSQTAGTTTTACVTELVAHEVEVAFASESVDDEPDHLVERDAPFDDRTRKIEVRHSWQEKKIQLGMRLETEVLVAFCAAV